MRTSLLGLAVVAALGMVNAGCSGKANFSAKIETPKAEPTDTDGDGINDDVDKCVNEKEDGAPPDPKDGCPNNDPDGDGIVGAADKCPNEPETKNGHQDDDGCPDEVPRVVLTDKEVKITEKIMFEFGRADIKAESHGLLDEITKVIQDNPQVEFVEVAGHADNVGDDFGNRSLTDRRAKSVVAYLTGKGVMKERLRAVGYGFHCPVDPADTDEAREKNRRVEFKVLRINGKETGVALGCDAAAAKGIKAQPVPKNAPTKAEIEKAGKGSGGDKKLTDSLGGDKKEEKKANK
jgi:OOP family OmpA-OmpF porin